MPSPYTVTSRRRSALHRPHPCPTMARLPSRDSKAQRAAKIAAAARKEERKRACETAKRDRLQYNSALEVGPGWAHMPGVIANAMDEAAEGLTALRKPAARELGKPNSPLLTPVFNSKEMDNKTYIPNSSGVASRMLLYAHSLVEDDSEEAKMALQGLQVILKAVRKFLGRNSGHQPHLVSEKLNFKDPGIIISRGTRTRRAKRPEDAGDQMMHTDFPCAEAGFSCICNLTLGAPARLRVAGVFDPKLHTDVSSSQVEHTVVLLEYGDLLLLRGDVLHSGMEYQQDHLRGFIEINSMDHIQGTVVNNVLSPYSAVALISI